MYKFNTCKLTAYLLLMVVSCKLSAQTTQTEASLTNFEATSLSTQPKMFGIPLVANVKIIEGAKHTFTFETIIKLPDRQEKESDGSYTNRINKFVKDRIEEVKTEAIFNFADETQADVIVSPSFSMTTESSNGLTMKMKVKVRGYPAKYDNFRNLSAQDEKLIELSAKVGNSGAKIIEIGSTEYEKEIIEK